MDELREEILRRLHEMYDGKSAGYYEVNCTALSIAWGIVGAKYPGATFCEVYDIANEAAQEICFGEGK